jgi:hypothetical protein
MALQPMQDGLVQSSKITELAYAARRATDTYREVGKRSAHLLSERSFRLPGLSTNCVCMASCLGHTDSDYQVVCYSCNMIFVSCFIRMVPPQHLNPACSLTCLKVLAIKHQPGTLSFPE